MAKQKTVRVGGNRYLYESGEAVKFMHPGEPRRMLSPVDRSVLIALDGRMTRKEIMEKSGISPIAFVLSCYRLVALGLIKERAHRK